MKTTNPNLTNIGQKWPEILIPFSFDYKIKLTASEISKKSDLPLRTISRVLIKLVKINLLKYDFEGKNKKYFFNLENPQSKLVLQIVESLKFSFDKKDIFVLLIEIISQRETVLFGSHAKNISTESSDIDLLVIGKNSEKIKDIVREQQKEINIHFSTIKEFEKLLNKKQALAIEIMKNHIVFGGSQFIDFCWRYYYDKQ